MITSREGLYVVPFLSIVYISYVQSLISSGSILSYLCHDPRLYAFTLRSVQSHHRKTFLITILQFERCLPPFDVNLMHSDRGGGMFSFLDRKEL